MRDANRLSIISANQLQEARADVLNCKDTLGDWKYKNSLLKAHIDSLEETIQQHPDDQELLENAFWKTNIERFEKELSNSRKTTKESYFLILKLIEFMKPEERELFRQHIDNYSQSKIKKGTAPRKILDMDIQLMDDDDSDSSSGNTVCIAYVTSYRCS